MIVTRHRKPRPHLARFVVPLILVVLLVAASMWPPSQRFIAKGPLHPVWSVAATTGGAIARPLTFAGQQDTITERNRRIRQLDAELERQRRAKADADARTQELQQQLTALANQPHDTPAPAPRPTAAPNAGLAGGLAGNAPAAAATPEDRRLAATWAAMEPEKAAAIVQRLPDDAVTRVLAQMDADSAGAIMNALPATAAARISRAVAQVPPGAGR